MAGYATVLRDHVTLTGRSIGRIFLQAFVPRLQSLGQVCTFLRCQRGFPIPSSAAFGEIGDPHLNGIHRFARTNGNPTGSRWPTSAHAVPTLCVSSESVARPCRGLTRLEWDRPGVRAEHGGHEETIE
jgi:hypothetical protein